MMGRKRDGIRQNEKIVSGKQYNNKLGGYMASWWSHYKYSAEGPQFVPQIPQSAIRVHKKNRTTTHKSLQHTQSYYPANTK